MAGTRATALLRRWQRRRSTRAARRYWRWALIAGFALWYLLVRQWAVAHGHYSWVTGYRTWAGALAAVTFWPSAGVLWCLMYPSDVWPGRREDDDRPI